MIILPLLCGRSTFEENNDVNTLMRIYNILEASVLAAASRACDLQ